MLADAPEIAGKDLDNLCYRLFGLLELEPTPDNGAIYEKYCLEWDKTNH